MGHPGTTSIGVVGAGVAGLTAAHALRSAGFAVAVFERAPALRAVGGALVLWPNALAALDRLGLRARLLALASTQIVALRTGLRAAFLTQLDWLFTGP